MSSSIRDSYEGCYEEKNKNSVSCNSKISVSSVNSSSKKDRFFSKRLNKVYSESNVGVFVDKEQHSLCSVVSMGSDGRKMFVLKPEYENTKIQDIINHYNKKLSYHKEKTSTLLDKITSNNPLIQNFAKLNNSCFQSITDKDNLLKDMTFENKIFHHWRSFLKKKQEYSNTNNKLYETFQDELNSTDSDDIVCVVCNDGDYEENDLIVYCAVSLFF